MHEVEKGTVVEGLEQVEMASDNGSMYVNVVHVADDVGMVNKIQLYAYSAQLHTTWL